jgi:hypothetical protein
MAINRPCPCPWPWAGQRPAGLSFLLFEAEAAGLAGVNDQVNALFE